MVIRDRFNVRSDWEDFSNTIVGRRHEVRDEVQRIPGGREISKQPAQTGAPLTSEHYDDHSEEE
jgi:hypothetical protein